MDRHAYVFIFRVGGRPRRRVLRVQRLVGRVITTLLYGFRVESFFRPLLHLLKQRLICQLRREDRCLRFASIFFPRDDNRLEIQFVYDNGLLSFEREGARVRLVSGALLTRTNESRSVRHRTGLNPCFFWFVLWRALCCSL